VLKKIKKINLQKTWSKVLKTRRLKYLFFFFLFLSALFYFGRRFFVVALVNGRPITRIALIKELEKQGGQQVLDGLITKSLILQAAKKEKVVVSQEEINQAVRQLRENFSSQGQNLSDLLALQGITENDLKEQIKIQKLAEKIAGKDVQVSDQEVNDYLEQNKELIPQDADQEEIKNSVREQLRQQKLNEKIQNWIQSLREKAKIYYF